MQQAQQLELVGRDARVLPQVRSAVLNTNIYKLKQSRLKMVLEGDKVQHNFGFVNDEGFRVPKREFWTWDESDQDMFFEPFEKWADTWIAGP